MKSKIVFATHNMHKLKEVAALLAPSYQVVGLADIGCNEDIPESASSLEGNAYLKSKYVYDTYGLNCFSDDTGLEVAALNGAPGVYSARYATEGNDSEANMQKLLRELEGVEQRDAQFRTVISLIVEGKEYQFEGVVHGDIVQTKRGSAGFGYDPIFQPKGYEQTFGELGDAVKNKISHRALAINQLIEFLKKYEK